MSTFPRRNFLKLSGLSLLPGLIPVAAAAVPQIPGKQVAPPSTKIVKLFGDGEIYNPGEYLEILQQANGSNAIQRDRYGTGGAVEMLEKKFIELTGKESAIFMPTGTMANQLAISELSGESSKIFVQDTSHVYRDEADAAQSVFQKRLMPLAKNETFFTAEQLQQAIEALKEEEVFKTSVGAVSIENPVRRMDGRVVPLEELRKIRKYCLANNVKLHLDGARIFIASAWTGVSIKEYASNCDTIYVSLYKYFGAGGGAMLCGPKEIIDKMPHLIKVHGGAMFSNWVNAAMALHKMEGFENRLLNAKKAAEELFAELNRLPGVKISALDGGSNIYAMQLAKDIDGKKMPEKLEADFDIWMPRPNENNKVMIAVNETILYQGKDYLVNAFKKSI